MKVKIMSRALDLALSQFEARSLALPSFARLRSVFARATQVEAAASALYSENQSIRSSSRGWMI